MSSALKLSAQCNKMEQDISLSLSWQAVTVTRPCAQIKPDGVRIRTLFFSFLWESQWQVACRDLGVPGLFPEVATCKLPVTNISPLSRQLWSCSVLDAWVRIYDGQVKTIWSLAPLCPGPEVSSRQIKFDDFLTLRILFLLIHDQPQPGWWELML